MKKPDKNKTTTYSNGNKTNTYGDKNKTSTYGDKNKTSIYGDDKKLTRETVHHLKAGDNITLNNNKYNILEIISESTGEAVIYKIENKEQKIFALKLYFEFKDAENEPNTEALSRIKNIDDEDILNLIDFGTGINKYKGRYCFEISDFAYGFDLLSIKSIKEKYSLDFTIKEVIPQIFLGILKLHESRIYHCDLKPQNIFFLDKEQKEIVIGDYGSAKTFDFDAAKSSRKTTTVKGTDFYLPPEQARGFISEKNDFYSFGMVLLHLFYPEKILTNENEPKSLSHEKLKEIIERQFEAKEIIEFNPKYKTINSLIEGLTLVDFNLRWGKEQVEQWIKGEQIKVIYQKSAQTLDANQISTEKALNFGKYTINTPNDLRDYVLNDENWYEDLIEDTDNWNDFINWTLGLYKGDKRKRSAINRIVKYYSQEGIDFIAEAIIRFFIPEHPVIFGLKSFDFANSNDLKKTTAETFSHLISDLWDNLSNKDIKLYLFRYEFALRQLESKQPEVLDLLKILYKELNIREKIREDFYNYKVYAYTSVSKKSLNNIKRFLYKYLPSDFEINFISLNQPDKLHYSLKVTLTEYLTQIGVNNELFEDNYSYRADKTLPGEDRQRRAKSGKIISDSSSEEIITVNYPGHYNSIERFYNKTTDVIFESIGKKHHINKSMFLKNSVEIFNSNFEDAYVELLETLKDQYIQLKNELSRKIKRQNPVKNNLKEFVSIIDGQKFHKISVAFNLLNESRKYANNYSFQKKQKSQRNNTDGKTTRKGIFKNQSPAIKIRNFILLLIIISTIFEIFYVILKSKTDIKIPDITLINDKPPEYVYKTTVNKDIALEQIVMIPVNGGTFFMGHRNGPANEKPLHTVLLDDFFISKYEITNEQYCHFLNDYGSIKVKSGEYEGKKMIYYSNEEDRDWGIIHTENGWQPSRGYQNYPVVYVTWYGANEYCKWTGGSLPTEAQWEYAARGGNRAKGYKYVGGNNIHDVAWYKDNSRTHTHKVGTKESNELGLYDMGGNVFEWCQDYYDENYYSKSPENNPINLTKSKYKVLRGGSYYSSSGSNMPCYRIGYELNSYYSNYGFRLCSDYEISYKEE